MVPLDHCRGCYFHRGFVPEQNNKYNPETSLCIAQKPVLLLPLLLHPLIPGSAGQAGACYQNTSTVRNSMLATRLLQKDKNKTLYSTSKFYTLLGKRFHRNC